MNKTSLGEVLFTKTQRRVLGLLFGNPDRSYYANEIVRYAGAGIGAVQRELERLESVQLLISSRIGNQKHYQANRQAPIFEELSGIVLKTFGVGDHLKKVLMPLEKKISIALIYGSLARNSDRVQSDIDLMIISDDLTYPELLEAIAAAQEQVQRPINPSIYSHEEWQRKSGEEGGFISRVMAQPKVFLLGSNDDLLQA